MKKYSMQWQGRANAYSEAGDAVIDDLLVAKVLGPAANDSLWVWETENGFIVSILS